MVQSDTIYMITLLIYSIISNSFAETLTYNCGGNTNDVINYSCTTDGKLSSTFAVPSACDPKKPEIQSHLSAACSEAFDKEDAKIRKEIREECKEFSKEIKEACGALKITGCQKRLKECGQAKTARLKAKYCKGILDVIPSEVAEDTLESAKDDFETSETKLQDLQDKLTEAQADALEKQQSTEEKISSLQEKLAQVPTKAQELALKNEGERDKTLLTHIDNLNKVTDELQSITDALHDAESQLINKRNELLTTCELEARGKQQARIAEKNQKKAVGRNTVTSLSEAIQSSYVTTQDGKKVLRNTKEIVRRFERCQKTRLHQTGLQAAERNYQRTLIALESKRKSVEKQQNSMEARLEASLRMNNKASELEMASLAQEQAAMQNQVLMLQKQVLSNEQQAQANIAQIQQSIQKAQFEQYQKQQSMFSAINMSNLSKQGGNIDEDDADKIASAVGYFEQFDDDESLGGTNGVGLYCTDKSLIDEEVENRRGDGGET
jgi:hypothetical protein